MYSNQGVKMKRRFSTWLLVPLAGALLIAGCGSSSSSSSSSSAPATTAATTTTTTAKTTTGAGAAGAVAACKNGVHNATTLSASTRSKIERVCEKAAGGDKEAVTKAAQEICEELVKSSPIPSDSIKEKALASCKHKS